MARFLEIILEKMKSFCNFVSDFFCINVIWSGCTLQAGGVISRNVEVFKYSRDLRDKNRPWLSSPTASCGQSYKTHYDRKLRR